MSLRFAKLPDEMESEEEREESDGGFAVPDTEPYKDLNWSRLLDIGNASLCIAKIGIGIESEIGSESEMKPEKSE